MAKKSDIKKDLLDQLERNGTVGEYYGDLVNDYMILWDAKSKLLADIKKRGTKVDVIMTGGFVNIKTNDSIADLIRVNSQMLKILDSLGLKPTQTDGDEDEL